MEGLLVPFAVAGKKPKKWFARKTLKGTHQTKDFTTVGKSLGEEKTKK